MNEWVWTALSLSLSGALVALILFALRPLWKNRLRKSWQYYIWLVVLLRLLVPFGPEHSLMGELFARGPQDEAAVTEPASARTEQMETRAGKVEAAPAPINAQPSYLAELFDGELPQPAAEESATAPPAPAASAAEAPAPVPEAENPTIEPTPTGGGFAWGNLVEYAWVLWLAGAALILAHRVGGYRLFLRRLRRDLAPVEDEALQAVYRAACAEAGVRRAPRLCLSDAVSSPLLAGTLRPRIVLPRKSAGAEELRGVLLHELTHHRRRDLWYKWLAQLALCVHWFNPVVHLVVRQIGRDCELSCDEAVIRTMDRDGQFRYGDTLLATVRKGLPAPVSAGSLSMSEDARLLKERLGSILEYQKKPRYTLYISLALTLVLLIGAAFVGVYASASHGAAVGRENGKTKVAAASLPNGRDTGAETTTLATKGNTGNFGGNGSGIWVTRDDLQKGTLPETASKATEIILKIDSAGFRIEESADGSIYYEYIPGLHSMKYSDESDRLTLELTGNPGYRSREDTSFVLYLPARSWTKFEVDCDSSAVSFTAPNVAASLKIEDSAVSVGLPETYTGSLALTGEDSAISVLLQTAPSDLTVRVTAPDSAVALPPSFPSFYLSRGAYEHTVGNGTGKLDIVLDSCAFSLAIKDQKNYGYDYSNYSYDYTNSYVPTGYDSWGNYYANLWTNVWKDAAWAVSWDQEAWEKAWSEAWTEANWEQTWTDAWEAVNWEETWNEAWDAAWNEVDWDTIWADAWQEALDELRAA